MIPLIFLDTETTGLRPDIHAPWEVAWQTAVHNRADRSLTLHRAATRLIALPTNIMRDADEAALRIGRYHERWSFPCSHPQLVMGELASDCAHISRRAGTPDVPHLVGAVPSFDTAMLARWLGWPGFGEGLWHYHLIDVEVLAAGHLRLDPPYTSQEINDLYGITVTDEAKHTAAGDVRWAVEMYAATYGLAIIHQEEAAT